MPTFNHHSVRARNKQTKFGIIIGGLTYEWQFDNLFTASRTKPIVALDIESLGVLDTDPWFGSVPLKPTLRRIAIEIKRIESSDCSYPCIIVTEIGLIDGFHRLLKNYLQGISMVNCVEFTISELMKLPHLIVRKD